MNFRNVSLLGTRLSYLFTQFATERAWQDAVHQVAATHHTGYPNLVCPRNSGQGDDPPVKDACHATASAYRVHLASYLGKGRQICGATDQIPEQLRLRALAVHALDAKGVRVGFEVIDGRDLEAAIARQLADPRAACLRICSALRGCYAARVKRA
jgi:hypothetical protein